MLSSATAWMACLHLPHVYLLHLCHKACTRTLSSPRNAQTCLFVRCTKRHVLATCRENEKERGGVRERDGNIKIKRDRLFLQTVVTSHPSLSSSLCLYVTHIVARNIISCSKQEVKNNISHRNLGSGESCLTGMADYWCIFNKVKDLQWCMWLPFQSGRPCHLFGAANSRDVSNGEADWRSAENRGIKDEGTRKEAGENI